MPRDPALAAEAQRVAQLMLNMPGARFVFGSNRAGIHGAGAARVAARDYGAVPGVGVGLTGRAFAVPTKTTPWRSRPLAAVQRTVRAAVVYQAGLPDDTFVWTRVGCGRAGFTDAEMAAALVGLAIPAHVLLPPPWVDWLAAHDATPPGRP